MKYDVNQYSDVEVVSTVVEKDLTLSADSTSMIFQLFSKSIYSNPIGSVVREITSNCFDSHVEANVDKPVIIKKSFDNQTNTHFVSFIDFGVGMSPERIDKIFSVYFTSTKRADNKQIGGFGLGSKSPLAYKRQTGLGEGEYDNTYYIITVFDKMKYTYQIYEGNKCPKISLLHSEITTQGNGTEVRIPVLQKDINAFEKEMVRQLYYFENVIFEGFEKQTLTNTYQIVRGKSFLFRGSEYSEYVHVCLGRVAYPINFDTLGINQYDFKLPVAIRLEVGEIGVTVSRESLDYSDITIKVLKRKLEEVKAEIAQMLAKQYDSIVSLEDYFKAKHKFGELYMPNGASISVGDSVVKQKDINFSNFKFKLIKMIDDKRMFNFFFTSRLYGKKETSYSRRYRDSEGCFYGGYEEVLNKTNVYWFEGEFKRKIVKQAYLNSLHTRYYMVSKRNLLDDSALNIFSLRKEIADVFSISDVLVDDKGKATKAMKLFIAMQEEYFGIVRKHHEDYNELVVPQDFIDDRKNVITKEMRETTIPAKFVDLYSRERIKLDSLFKLKCPIFYCTVDEEYIAKRAVRMFKLLFDENMIITGYNEYNHTFRTNGKKQIMFIALAKNNIKYMEFCQNAIHISRFNSMYMHRKENMIIEYFQTRNFIEKYEDIKGLYLSPEFGKLSPSWGKKTNKLNKFMKTVKDTQKKDFYRFKDTLALYYNLSDIKQTKEQVAYGKIIDELKELEDLNKDVLCYIDIPYRLENAPEPFWNILKKVLVY